MANFSIVSKFSVVARLASNWAAEFSRVNKFVVKSARVVIQSPFGECS